MSVRAGLFGLLVLATFGAFFVAQNLKNSPAAIPRVSYPGIFSPNGDGRREAFGFNVLLREADRVTVTVLDDDGDEVYELVDDVALGAYRALRPTPTWDGTDEDGRPVPDGRYRLRLTLRDQGRNVVLPRSFRKDTTPPQPRVLAMGPEPGDGPELLPRSDGQSAIARFPAALRDGRVTLFHTAPGPPREVLSEPLAPRTRQWRWDGRLDGRRAPAGTYLVVVQWRDSAGNLGTSAPLDDRGLPRFVAGQRLRSRGGITVRYLGVQTPGEPVRAGERFQACIDARQEPYAWTLRRIGETQVRSRGRGTRPCINPQAPGEASGGYVLQVRTRDRTTEAPVIVQARRPLRGSVEDPAGVLVVLPYQTWQGRNSADDDGDGLPDVLDRGVSVGLDRILTEGLPRQLREREAPLLRWLDRSGRRYDLTTDLALERGAGSALAGHRGVLLAGDMRWLTARVRRDLRTFVRRGGRLMTLGVDSLRRTVEVSRSGRRLAGALPPGRTDLFGLRVAPVARTTTDLEVSPLPDEIGLFTGTAGRFESIDSWEETASLGQEADAVASAVTVQPTGRTVIVAATFGDGLLLRPGIPDLPTRLDRDLPLTTLMERSWTLLSR